jgi:hypothetical protein
MSALERIPLVISHPRTSLGVLVLGFVLALGGTLRVVEAGHEITFYPSFYPQEITLTFMEPAAAARALRAEKDRLHAYVGPDPFAPATAPTGARTVESFRSWIVLTFPKEAGAPGFADAAARCAAAGRVARTLAAAKTDVVPLPYPVTPYHPDYLAHVDLVEAARTELTRGDDVGRAKPSPASHEGAGPRLAVRGALAASLPVMARASEKDADAVLEEVELGELLRGKATVMDGWAGPPWLREGWFQAYLLEADRIADPATRRVVEDAYARRTGGGFASLAERLTLERQLVSALGRGCERVVLGYRTQRQAFSDEYSDGVENVGHDAQAGLDSAIFIRTVKLKDFPWNGWLRVGAPRGNSAWNPVAGFTDDAGRLLRAAVLDPALLPSPQGSGWVSNRVQPQPTPPGQPPAPGIPATVEMPVDALVPDPGTGALRRVGRGRTAAQKITYRVLASAFHDGTRLTVADLLYPYAFAARWSARDADRGLHYDPVVDRATALVRERLAGVKAVRVDTQIRDLGELQLVYEVPLVEVYLSRGGDEGEAAALAPPWSAVPWQLTVLMEEAVTRGLAAFSEDEARRRGIPWLDLARDRKLTDALGALVDGFERRAYVPEALRGLVTVDQARQRWAALRRFQKKHGHFLVTSGPYRLERWSADGAVLGVFRDLSYPLAVGMWDRHAIPLKAFVVRTERRGDRLELEPEVEAIEKSERSYKIVREPYRPMGGGEPAAEALVAHYAVIGPAQEVVAAGTSSRREGGRVIVDLAGKLKPGTYQVLLALALHGNLVNPEVKMLPYRVGE